MAHNIAMDAYHPRAVEDQNRAEEAYAWSVFRPVVVNSQKFDEDPDPHPH